MFRIPMLGAFLWMASAVADSGSISWADSPAPETIAALKKLGAKIQSNSEGRIISIGLGERKVTDDDLVHLKGLQHPALSEKTSHYATSRSRRESTSCNFGVIPCGPAAARIASWRQ